MAYMVWGVEDEIHDVVGTDFNPDSKKVGNQGLALWLANGLQPSIAFSFRPRLTGYPERYQRLIERLRPYRWEQGIALQYASGD